MLTLSHFLSLGTILFLIGIFGILYQRNFGGILLSFLILFSSSILILISLAEYIPYQVETPSVLSILIILFLFFELLAAVVLILKEYRQTE